eukprot:COSAG06_NODE_8879_length_2043_cov_1.974794_1_plen_28_part_10
MRRRLGAEAAGYKLRYCYCTTTPVHCSD